MKTVSIIVGGRGFTTSLDANQALNALMNSMAVAIHLSRSKDA